MSKLKKFLLAFVVLFVGIQLVTPEENISTAPSANHISNVFHTPEEVHAVLKTSCYDCHSNNTVYPWYNRIQPVAWWLNHHVNEGKEKLNFDEYAVYNLRRQYHKMEETEEMIAENEMPLSSYTLIHRNAILSEQQKQVLTDWTKSIRKEMESKYPMDSLIRKK
ncbi:MAG: heme-binding domain-containing protein [Bacteroidota bacterium]